MKGNNRISRRKVKLKLIETYKYLFYCLDQNSQDPYKYMMKRYEYRRIAVLARRFIGYSPKTVDVDIVWPLYMLYKDNLPNKTPQ